MSMSSIRCCVFDLDGTLLNSNDKITPNTRDTLIKLQAQGCYIVIATGRCDLQILEYIDELKINGPIIACNGGYIKDIKTGEALRARTFRPEHIRELIDCCNENHLDHMVYLKDRVYYADGSRRVLKFKRYNETSKPEHRVPLCCIKDADMEYIYHNTLKLLVIGNPELKDVIDARFNGDGRFTAVMSGENLIDIMPGHTSKGEGVSFLAEKLGIPLSQVAVFGDSPNDESMFRVAGFPIAMGNAEPEIKELACYVTRSNDDDGILHALRHFNVI